MALTVLAKAANLAEVAQFACLALRRVEGASREIWFAVRFGSVEILFRGLETDSASVRMDARDGERDLLRRVQTVVIDTITMTAPIPA